MGRGWIIALLTLPNVASAHPGNGIVALSDRAVITGDALHNAVWRFEKGKVPVKLTGGTRFHCHWVTKGLDGRLYSETLSERNGRWVDTVFRMDSQGANPSEVASGAETAFGIFAVGRAGEIIQQIDSRIMAWSRGKNTPFRGSGKVEHGGPALGEVHAFAWGRKDTLSLADGPHVRRIGADGVVRLAATIGGRVTDALYAGPNGAVKIWGLAVDSRGRTFAAVPSNGQVIRINLDGSQQVVSRGEGGWQATGVAVFGENVFLLESKTRGNSNSGPRVRVLRDDGKVEVLGTSSGRP